jgi:hypothetical protein
MSTPVNNDPNVTPVSQSPYASAHTIQAFVELVYVQTANNVMVSQMASLETALEVSQRAMGYLTTLQNLHNAVQVEQRPALTGVSGGISVSKYQTLATGQFNTPLKVETDYSLVSGGQAGFLAQMQTLKAQISGMIPSLEAVTPTSQQGADTNSLLANMQTILSDLNNTHAASTAAGASAWLTDQYNISTTTNSSAGIYQQHITNAITAGQSLNTSQTEAVRNYLYVYEEYYKSASAVLTAISQIISKMAGGIAR